MRKSYCQIWCVLAAIALACSLAVAQEAAKKAGADKPKPEAVLRQMADYLAKLPAMSCKVEAKLDANEDGEEHHQLGKMTVRLQRPNRLALILDEGEMGITVVSDGKRLVQ